MNFNEIKYNIKYGYSALAIMMVSFVVIFILMTLAGGSTQIDVLLKFGANNVLLVIQKHEYFRLITNAFLHIGLLHLLFNLVAFYYIARFVEDSYGALKMVSVFIFTALIASIFSAVVAYFLNPATISAGASGGIFGLTGLLLGNTFKKETYSYGLGLDRSKLILFIVLNLVIGFSIGGVDNAAHIGGLIAGIILGLILNTRETFSVSKITLVIEKIFYVFCLTILFLSFMLLILTNFI